MRSVRPFAFARSRGDWPERSGRAPSPWARTSSSIIAALPRDTAWWSARPAAIVGDVRIRAARQQQPRLRELSPAHQLVQNRPPVLARLIDAGAVRDREVEQIRAAVPRRRRDRRRRVEAALQEQREHRGLPGADDEVGDVDVVSPARACGLEIGAGVEQDPRGLDEAAGDVRLPVPEARAGAALERREHAGVPRLHDLRIVGDPARHRRARRRRAASVNTSTLAPARCRTPTYSGDPTNAAMTTARADGHPPSPWGFAPWLRAATRDTPPARPTAPGRCAACPGSAHGADGSGDRWH